MRRRWPTVKGNGLQGLGVVALVAAAMLSLPGCARRPDRDDRTRKMGWTELPSLVECDTSALTANELTIELLIDDSGSMKGFERTVPTVSRWVGNALSLMRTQVEVADEPQRCLFSFRSQIHGCEAITQGMMTYTASTESSFLHGAIERGSQNDLTFILTDGVAAVGASGVDDCSSGIDAPCVARRLLDFVDRARTSASGAGVHVVPVFAYHIGPLYTEERAPLETIDEAAIEETVRGEVGQEVIVRNRRTVGGALVYDYSGPRPLVLVVLSRNALIGREAVRLLEIAAGELRIERKSGVASAEPGELSFARAIEIFPGRSPRYVVQGIAALDDPNAHQGTMDVTPARPLVRLGCLPGTAAFSTWGIGFEELRYPADSACRDFESAVPTRVRVEVSAGLSQLLPSGVGADLSGQTLPLVLGCPEGEDAGGPGCDSPGVIRWLGEPDFNAAARCLQSCSGENGCDDCPEVIPLIARLTTSAAIENPHKIFGLRTILQAFYLGQPRVGGATEVASIQVCREE